MKMHFTCLCNVTCESVKWRVAHDALPPAPSKNRALRHYTDWDLNRTHSPPCSLRESLEIRKKNWALGSLHPNSRAHPKTAKCKRADAALAAQVSDQRAAVLRDEKSERSPTRSSELVPRAETAHCTSSQAAPPRGR